MPVEFTGKFTQGFWNDPEDGTHTDGSGLYLFVRNNGKWRTVSVRDRGRRYTLGSGNEIRLEQAQAETRRIRDQQERAKVGKAKDPFPVKAADAAEANVETLSAAVHAFRERKIRDKEWGTKAQKWSMTIINKYVDGIYGKAYAHRPLTDIDRVDIRDTFKPTWLTSPVIAKRGILMFRDVFDDAIEDEPPRYFGPNPVNLKKDSWLRKQLGKQQRGGHRLGILPEDVPTVVDHLLTPLFAHGDDELTTAEAAEAMGIDTETILKERKKGKEGRLPSSYKIAPWDHLHGTWIHKIAELKKIRPFKQEPRLRAVIPPHASVLLFIIYTLVRSDMACQLQWSQRRPNRGIIDYGRNPDNTRLVRGHKMEGRDEKADYTVPLTSNTDVLFREMEEQQKRDGLWPECRYVFVHPTTRGGLNTFFGHKLTPNAINRYFKHTLIRCGIYPPGSDRKQMPSVHGLRNTFVEWACELNSSFDRKIVDAQLGHKQGGDNWMYYRNVKYIDQRREMMEQWEAFARSKWDEAAKASANKLLARVLGTKE